MQNVLSALVESVPDSKATLKGSLEQGTADLYSDIDIFWEVPDQEFQSSIKRLQETLSRVRAVESFRYDTEFSNSDRRRLIFARFEGVPLFYRVDIDVLAESVGGDLTYDVGNPHARGRNLWSPGESALMNCVASVKARLRGRDDEATDILFKGYDRVGVSPPDKSLKALIRHLADAVEATDATTAVLAKRVRDLVNAAW